MRWICVSLLLITACGSGGGGLCQDDCGSPDDCADGYTCIAVGSPTNGKCVPEEGGSCIGKACGVTPVSGGECTFKTCM